MTRTARRGMMNGPVRAAAMTFPRHSRSISRNRAAGAVRLAARAP